MIIKNKNLIYVTLAFSALLTCAQTAQQYITVIFEKAGDVSIGFTSLLIGQLFFLCGSVFAPIFITKYGPKTCFIYSTFFYVMFAVSVGIGERTFLYLSCMLVGIAAGILWNGHFVFMGAISEPKERARNAGFFWAIFSALTGIGMILSAFLIDKFSTEIVFAGYAALGALAFVPLLKLDDVGRGRLGNLPWQRRAPLLKSKTVLRASSTILATYMTYGLVISFIPLEIAEIAGLDMVGYLSALFFIIPTFASYPLGKLSDKFGHFPAIFIGLGMTGLGLITLYAATHTLILVIGILVVTLGFAVLNPLMTALPTDISPNGMTERISATFNVASAIGILIGIMTPFIFYDKSAYLILLFLVCTVAVFIRPFTKVKFDQIKLKISEELALKEEFEK